MITELRPIQNFSYYAPSSLAEALELVKEHQGTARLLAGGTDLLLKMKKRTVSPEVIIDLNNIAELSFIELVDNNLRIGGLTRLADIEVSSVVKEKVTALAKAIHVLAASQLRNRATVAGNICNASPAADTAPALLVLDASVKLQSADAERIVAVSQFLVGPEQTIVKPDEILTEIIIPLHEGSSTFIKFGRRKAFTLSVASVAAFVNVKEGKFTEVRVALGAVAPTPIRVNRVEDALTGYAVNEENITRAAHLVREQCCPITDVRATAEYRTEMAYVLTRRALNQLGRGE